MESKEKGKSKYRGAVIVGVLTFAIGIIIAIQISTTGGEAQGALVPLAKVKSYEAELSKVNAEKEDALAELEDVQARLKKLQESESNENDYVRSLIDEKEKYQVQAGLTDVKGEGLAITIKDPPATGSEANEISTITYNCELLLSLVNKLKEAGAEAISINDERIVQTTEISLAGGNVNINGNATAPPYTVKAIGPADIMKSAITIRMGIVDQMTGDFNLVVKISSRDKLKIEKYNGVVSLDYAKAVK